MMQMKDELIREIGKQLNIPQSAESDSEWLCQVIYSIAGKMALASLWDYDEMGTISIQHFKKRMEQIFFAYMDTYPPSKFVLPVENTALINEIYSVYLQSGYLYHRSNRLSPAVVAMANCGDITLYRGSSPDANWFMSGLGFYSMSTQNTERTVENIFGLQVQPFEAYLEELAGAGKWEPVEWPEGTEFLRLQPPFTKEYWRAVPEKDRISLARYGAPKRIYALYCFSDGMYQQKIVPEWRLTNYFIANGDDGEYRRIAIALLLRYKCLPPIQANTAGNFVEIRLGYRLPPSEEMFFKLYSWPIRYEFFGKDTQVFRRKMAKPIYPVFKCELEKMGYRFEEK